VGRIPRRDAVRRAWLCLIDGAATAYSGTQSIRWLM
jgi:hypothetical protein